MKKYLPSVSAFSRRQPSLDRFSVSRSGWASSDRFNGKSLRRTSAASLNPRSIQVVHGAYNIDLNKVDASFTKLHRACLLNDDAQVKKHLSKVDNNCHDSSHRYPIHLATVNGNFAIIKLLIDNGANPNVQDNEGHTPLIKSIECGHEHLVKFLLSNGADPDVSDMDNNTALHWAIMTEGIIAIDALLGSKKCDLSLRNNKDETCLHLAVRSPSIETPIFETMVRLDSDVNAKDQLGLTVLDIALACNNKKALNAFSRCGHTIVEKKEEQSNNLTNGSCGETSEVRGSSVTKVTEDYKQKYISKNRENLEYEKKIIQLNAQLERIRLDMSYTKEQNEKLQSDYKRLSSENSMLRLESKTLLEQLRAYKHREKMDENRLPKRDDNSNTSNLDATGETIDCRSHKEFLATKNMNQERINKLKNSLTT